MNNIVAQQKASTSQAAALVGCLFDVCHRLDLTPIPLKPKSKIPLVRWSDDSWKPTPVEPETWASKPVACRKPEQKLASRAKGRKKDTL